MAHWLDLCRSVGNDATNTGAEFKIVAEIDNSMKQRALRETALFLGLLFVGLVLMPIGIYQVGQEVFGNYGGQGYGDFFGTLSGKIRNGEPVAWFLVLSPYLAWQIVRLTVIAWRFASRPQSDNSSNPA